MEMIVYFLTLVVVLLYSIFLFRSLEYIKPTDSGNSISFDAPITLIIPFRNEENNLPELLSCIDRLNINSLNFSVLIVNDHSEDESCRIVSDWVSKTDINAELLNLTSGFGKKEAIKKAVDHSRHGSLIITTDADCTFGPDWLKSMVSKFVGHENTKLIVGPVWMNQQGGMLENFQTYEFAALQGVTMSTLAIGNPVMCNAANLLFEKSVYLSALDEGMKMELVSGDDIFLMQYIHNKYGAEAIAYNFDPHSIVNTEPLNNFKQFYHQRIRWAGKWKTGVQPIGVRLSGGLIFLMYVLLLISLILIVLNFVFYKSLIVLLSLMIKTVAEVVFLKRAFSFFGKSFYFSRILLLAVLYPLYSVFFGMLSLFKGFSWKDRKADNSGVWEMGNPEFSNFDRK
ncbi:glycosyltransferase [Mangrovivirga sp. M17]|uniref:Glycosyltransferase n=1 Tax=Mangrovivirga halotolerans TaxID=2993936 RepID=A0ABT3RQ37_9BACT|nr:glycosyltransferase [Mangrovivirga halotolerans]MCX2743697.1 glycosyltransferase [Mangrovivirga halotolerans]